MGPLLRGYGIIICLFNIRNIELHTLLLYMIMVGWCYSLHCQYMIYDYIVGIEFHRTKSFDWITVCIHFCIYIQAEGLTLPWRFSHRWWASWSQSMVYLTILLGSLLHASASIKLAAQMIHGSLEYNIGNFQIYSISSITDTSLSHQNVMAVLSTANITSASIYHQVW